jgi:hypothetical protein
MSAPQKVLRLTCPDDSCVWDMRQGADKKIFMRSENWNILGFTQKGYCPEGRDYLQEEAKMQFIKL